MNTEMISIARVYITESSNLLHTIVNYLKEEAHIHGFTVFRAVSGSGDTGEHTASLLSFSLDLPLVVELFDSPEKIQAVVAHLSTFIQPRHIVFWNAQTNA